MKKTAKRLVITGLTGALLLNGSMTAFAGTWRTGAEPNTNRWWYDFDNGTFAANGWQWIDGNNDGVAENYYFDAEGWMLANTTTPDGYTVNENGAWTVNDVVQTQTVQVQAAMGDFDYSWLDNADGTINYGAVDTAVQWAHMFADWTEQVKSITPGANWQGAFDRLQVPEDLGMGTGWGQDFKFVVTTPAGMTENDGKHAGAVVMTRVAINVPHYDTMNANVTIDENGVLTITVEGRTLPMGYEDVYDYNTEDSGVVG